jgi:hypothetical protein
LASQSLQSKCVTPKYPGLQVQYAFSSGEDENGGQVNCSLPPGQYVPATQVAAEHAAWLAVAD